MIPTRTRVCPDSGCPAPSRRRTRPSKPRVRGDAAGRRRAESWFIVPISADHAKSGIRGNYAGNLRTAGALRLHRFGRVRTLRGVELATDAIGRAALDGDQALWHRSVVGDGQAFAALFDRHRERVFRHACRLARTRHDAEDVVASAFLELWRRRDKVALVDGSVLPWLLVTTTNLGRNAARTKRRYREFLERLPRGEVQPDAAEVALDTHALGADGRLRDGLCALNKADAQLFALVALEGYPVGTAAELLGLSPSAASSRLHRVRTRLREQLVDEPPEHQPENQRGTR